MEHPIDDIIRQRRSIKPAQMSERPLERGHIEHLLENARWAPTHGLTQPWCFVVYRGESRQALATELRRLYTALTPQDVFRRDKHEKLGVAPLQAQAVIALCMARDPKGRISEQDEIQAVACATQNILLTASALGLAAHWSTPPIIQSLEMVRFLRLDSLSRCLGLLYLGWPKEGLSLDSPRDPITSKVRWVE